MKLKKLLFGSIITFALALFSFLKLPDVLAEENNVYSFEFEVFIDDTNNGYSTITFDELMLILMNESNTEIIQLDKVSDQYFNLENFTFSNDRFYLNDDDMQNSIVIYEDLSANMYDYIDNYYFKFKVNITNPEIYANWLKINDEIVTATNNFGKKILFNKVVAYTNNTVVEHEFTNTDTLEYIIGHNSKLTIDKISKSHSYNLFPLDVVKIIGNDIYVNNQKILADLTSTAYGFSIIPYSVYDEFDTNFNIHLFHNPYVQTGNLSATNLVAAYNLYLNVDDLSNTTPRPEHIINIPEEFKLLRYTNDLKDILDSGYLKVKETGHKAADIFYNDEQVRDQNLSTSTGKNKALYTLIPSDYQIVKTYTSVNKTGYQALLTNSTIFSDIKDELDNNNQFNNLLEEHQMFYYTETDNLSSYWNSNIDVEIPGNKVIDESVIIYRKLGWVDSTVTITFTSNVLLDDELDPLLIDLLDFGLQPKSFWRLEDIDFEFPTVTSDGNYFFRWVLYNNTEIPKYDYQIFTANNIGDIRLHAEFVDAAETVTVTIVGKNLTYTEEVIVGTGLTFDGWTEPFVYGYKYLGISLYPSSSATPNIESLTFDKDTTLYYVFEQIYYLTVTFNVNGGVYQPPMDIRHNGLKNLKDQLPTPIKSKAIFTGWFVDPELTIPVGNTIDFEHDNYQVTFYAAWYDNGVIVKFHTGTSSLVLSPVIITKGDNVNISIPPYRENYVFHGWFLDAEKTIEYDGYELYDDEVNLYAKWQYIGDGEEPPTENEPDETVADNYTTYIYITVAVAAAGLIGIIVSISKPKRKRRRW